MTPENLILRKIDEPLKRENTKNPRGREPDKCDSEARQCEKTRNIEFHKGFFMKFQTVRTKERSLRATRILIFSSFIDFRENNTVASLRDYRYTLNLLNRHILISCF